MYIPELQFSSVGYADFVGDAVVGAGGGCFGLAIQDYCAVQVFASLQIALSADRTRELGLPVNVKGKADKPKHFNSWIAKSNMPYPPSFVLLWKQIVHLGI